LQNVNHATHTFGVNHFAFSAGGIVSATTHQWFGDYEINFLPPPLSRANEQQVDRVDKFLALVYFDSGRLLFLCSNRASLSYRVR
jgi:hypothetical protein